MLTKDALNFPLGFDSSYPIIAIGGMEYSPIDFLRDAYKIGKNDFKARFEAALRKNLESKVSELESILETNRQPSNESLNYVHYSVSLIGFGHIDSLSDILLRMTKPQFDYDFPTVQVSWESDPKGNLYVASVSMLGILEKINLGEEFWNNYLDHSILGRNVVSPRSISPWRGVQRAIRYYERIESSNGIEGAYAAAMMAFDKYIGLNSSTGESVEASVSLIRDEIGATSNTPETKIELLKILEYNKRITIKDLKPAAQLSSPI